MPSSEQQSRRLSDRALVLIALAIVIALLVSVVIALMTLYAPELTPVSLPTSAKV